MTLRLFNTLTGQIDPLEPADGKALRMYACGPTVYDYGHIGNFRILQVDLLRRFLLLSGMHVLHVMNITDVDDKIIRNSIETGMRSASIRRYVDAFCRDMEALRIRARSRLQRDRLHSPDGEVGASWRRRRRVQD